MKKLFVLAIATSEPCEEDGGVPGVYEVSVKNDIPPGQMANHALDSFHCSCPIDTLDSFTFVVVDADTGISLSEDSNLGSYETNGECGVVKLEGSDVPEKSLYFVLFKLKRADPSKSQDYYFHVYARNEEAARTLAMRNCWEGRVAMPGDSPFIHAEKVSLEYVGDDGGVEKP